jgi:crotonobetainyl-CoA:carnitine CoA-transferase CaiB-like acyl-CoA transferase
VPKNDVRSGPLAGVRVLELASMYAGPTAGRLLRDFGAEIIKVEDPSTGDYARQWVPQKNGVALGFTRLNSGKRSVGIDLRSHEGQEIARNLAQESDVVIESFRPGRLEAWGLGFEELRRTNPGLIMARVSGFGQTGPYSSRPGFGTIAEAMSGFAYINGWPDTPPTAPPFGFADSIAGFAAAFGVTMSLHRRATTGRGELVDVALYEPLLFILGDSILRWTTLQEVTERLGNSTGAASPRGIYKAADGRWVAIAASSQTIALRLFDAMGRNELGSDDRYATNAARLANDASLQAIVRGWIGGRSRDEVLTILDNHEVVAAPVNNAREVSSDPHFIERTLVAFHGDRLGEAVMPGPILRSGDYTGPSYGEAPELGVDTEVVLREVVGLPAERIDALVESGVISPSAASAG